MQKPNFASGSSNSNHERRHSWKKKKKKKEKNEPTLKSSTTSIKREKWSLRPVCMCVCVCVCVSVRRENGREYLACGWLRPRRPAACRCCARSRADAEDADGADGWEGRSPGTRGNRRKTVRGLSSACPACGAPSPKMQRRRYSSSDRVDPYDCCRTCRRLWPAPAPKAATSRRPRRPPWRPSDDSSAASSAAAAAAAAAAARCCSLVDAHLLAPMHARIRATARRLLHRLARVVFEKIAETSSPWEEIRRLSGSIDRGVQHTVTFRRWFPRGWWVLLVHDSHSSLSTIIRDFPWPVRSERLSTICWLSLAKLAKHTRENHRRLAAKFFTSVSVRPLRDAR